MENSPLSKCFSRTIFAMLMLHLGMPSGAAYGADTDSAPTLSFKLDYGPSTYKSELVDSNDTSYSMRYSVGIFAGETKSVVFAIKSDSNTTTFALNESEITTAWQETHILYRWTYFYVGAVISSLTMASNKEAADLFELAGNGYGGTLGTTIEFGRGGMFYLDVASVSIANVSEINQQDVSFGARTDIDIGCSFDITRRLLDISFGYRTRTLPVTLGESAAETLSTTYLGLNTSLYF